MSKKDDKEKDLTPDVPEANDPETGLIKCKVRALSERRYRAGMCFGPEDMEIEVDEAVLTALRADSLLKVTEG